MKIPIEGMKTVPMGEDIMIGAWIGLLVWASEKEDIVEDFKRDTGKDIKSFLNRTPIIRMIDEATGYDKDVVIAWADWVTENLWGIEGVEYKGDEI